MPNDEPTFEWQESSAGLSIRLPPPLIAKQSVGCATAILIIAALLALPVPILLVFRVTDGPPTDVVFWIVCGIVVIATLLLLGYALMSFRDARLPPETVEPGTISVGHNRIKIERAGRKRDMDYSWELDEIADIRLCLAAPDRIFLTPESLMKQALKPREIVRVSVERRTGEVDDVMVISSGQYWIDGLEVKLREYLELSGMTG